MKIVHITPTYFDEASIIGGGERYPTELASWMSRKADTTLVSFSSERRSYRQGGLKVEIYPVRHLIHGNKVNPLSFRFLCAIAGADVVHIHHIHTLVSDLACMAAAFLRKRVFVTDYGGGSGFKLNHRLPILGRYDGTIIYSQYMKAYLPAELQKKAVLIKGGIDTERFCPDPSVHREKKILYVGRILPHKGIDYLIEGFRLLSRPDYVLRIVGRIYHQDYYTRLRQLAEGLPIEFVHDADDERLLHEYRSAMVTILPSVHTNCYGNFTPVPELMGFTLLESQACGTPVICSDAGAMQEFIAKDESGCVVPQNSPAGLAEALASILAINNHKKFVANTRKAVLPLSWEHVVNAHLLTYMATII